MMDANTAKIVTAGVVLFAAGVGVVSLALSRTAMTWQSAAVNGKAYWVKNAPGKDKVADRLAQLEAALRKFLKDALVAYPDDARLLALRKRWDGTLSEVERPGDIAYSLNKKAIYVCVRARNDTIESFNTTMYVLLHEVAHVCTDKYGHPPVFWENFRWILEVAEGLGVYTYEDFDAIPVTHCGHRLGNNVLRCVKQNECTSLVKKYFPRG